MAEIRKNVKNIFKRIVISWSGFEQAKHGACIGTLEVVRLGRFRSHIISTYKLMNVPNP